MSGVRPPVVAGSFYPRGAAELAATVDRLLAEARPSPVLGGLRALVVPHAGYVFSGAVAAAGFATLPQARALRVALLGPSHFTQLRSVAVSGADGWLTPLGPVPVDGELRTTAVTAGAVVDDEPHARDHALEVELPFLQQRAGEELRVLPAAVGGPVDGTAGVVEALSRTCSSSSAPTSATSTTTRPPGGYTSADATARPRLRHISCAEAQQPGGVCPWRRCSSQNV